MYLILLGIIIAYTPRFLNAISSASDIIISSEELDKLDKEFRKKDLKTVAKKRAKNKNSRYRKPASRFDPNTYVKSDWMKLGLSEKQTDVILKFTKNGVDSDQELQSIYVISDELFQLVKDSTYYPERKKEVKESKQLIVDLNTGSEEELISLPGIGPYYAKKIVEYRTKLGGYHSSEQLLELWKFDGDKLEQIRPFITLSEDIKQISINLAGIDELKSHPYVSYQVANSIVKMRTSHGEYGSIGELKRSKLIDEELLVKLKPYLKL